MRKLLVGEALCQASQVRYYLLEDGPEEEEAYGVQVELEDKAEALPGLSSSRERVLALAEALARGVVTPVGLRDVVDDWLLE